MKHLHTRHSRCMNYVVCVLTGLCTYCKGKLLKFPQTTQSSDVLRLDPLADNCYFTIKSRHVTQTI